MCPGEATPSLKISLVLLFPVLFVKMNARKRVLKGKIMQNIYSGEKVLETTHNIHMYVLYEHEPLIFSERTK